MNNRTLTKLITTGMALLLLTVVAADVSLSDDDFNPPSIPTPVPVGGGGSSGGGGGGSGGSYTPPAFEAYTLPIKSSDGTMIGRQEGKNFNSVMIWAEKNGSIGNTMYVLTVEGETSQKIPDDGWLDITFETPDTTGLPEGMDGLALAKVKIAKKPDDWYYKSGSPKYTLKISGLTEGLDAGATYYLVRLDGANFQGQKVAPDIGSGQVSLKFTPSGDIGTFILLRAASPTPTPTSTLVATPTPTPMPASNNSGMTSVPILIGTFAVGAVLGILVMFLMAKKR
ncbi:hypothetical protein MCP_0931 [Methanocella paludicola SANAE]|uniref:Uncharacterized protein n=1 Tax=Methanocella paludicola (strain DSM 17711 / JCM 13418 / NBRC 101707 / SANAE) TaxID=304371 RepID=D1YX31_METPS|nr:hypothetical protein [Methanocella paludicola]BAI61003.1 hypothetical protein MCP_0931 [Methanocella paludicola SANAE]